MGAIDEFLPLILLETMQVMFFFMNYLIMLYLDRFSSQRHNDFNNHVEPLDGYTHCDNFCDLLFPSNSLSQN